MESESKMPDHDPTAADAEWKKIQQRTFTRWCNEHLKCANIVIYDLETDLCDGIKLIVLLEVLSHKRVGKYNKKPNFKSQKLENVAIALKFIEQENIKLVNIDAGHIVQGNLKLILGLIWTLILKYQISMPMGDYEFDDGGAGGGKGKDSGMTPKQALLAWVKSKMPPEIPMNNFTTDWNDGRAIAALVDACEPGLFPEIDPEDLDPADAVNNAETAMKTAEKYLGIPPVLDAADMCNPKVDEMSIMTYVSYFPDAKCKPGAPHRPNLPPASKCHAEGPGIEPTGLVAKQPAPFKLFAQHAGKGDPHVNVVGPDRKNLPCDLKDNGDKTYSCEYAPPTPGIYDVHVKWKGRHIPKSPFRVRVASDLDPTKCHADGPGLKSGIVEQQWTYFTVHTKGAGAGKLHVDIIDPHLSKDIETKITEKGDGEYYVEYKPAIHGKHTINLKFEGEHIPKSPFHVNVVSSKKEPVPSKVKAFGPGLEAKGVQAKTPTMFTVDASEGGDGELKILIKGPKGEVPCDIKDNGDGTYTITYTAPMEGRHTINITWSGKPIPKSPYKIEVSKFIDITKIKAYGPGLEKGYAGKPCKFTVETHGADVESLGFAVEGPHQAEIKCTDLGKGKCEVTYYPTKPGDYTVHVTCNGQDIPKSPFTVPIAPGGDASKCYAEGPGLEPTGNVAGTPAQFTVFTKDAGVGDVEVVVQDDKTGRSIKVETVANKDGTTTVTYHPDKPGKYTITVKFNGAPIPKSPYHVDIALNNPAKCKAYGPGLEKALVKQPAKFTIETIGAGEGGLGLTIEGPTETKIDCKDKGDGTCEVTYYPEEPGDHLINILYADKHIPNSPFTAKASYPVDASKVKISGPGLEPGVKAGLPADIDIDATEAGDAPLEVEVLNPQNKKVKVEVDEEKPGKFAATYYPEKPGKHTVNVKYGGKHVPNSPKKIDVKPKGDATKCKLKGPGLESPVVNEPTNFDVDCKRAGDGELTPTIVSPSGKNIEPVIKDNKDGTYNVEYTPDEVGPHDIDVKYDGDSIPDTPKKVNVQPKTDTSKVKAYGPGLESALTGKKAEFTVDTREAGPGGLSLAVEGPSEAKLVCKDNKDGTCSATYVPEEPGEYDVHVKFADTPIPGSPFKVKATRPVDASKVKCSGPGVEKAPIFEGVPTHFTVDTKEAGDAPLDITIETPEKKDAKPDSVTKIDDHTYEVKYTSPKQGRCAVDVKYGGKPVPNSPFRVRCGPPYDASKVKVTGPAVEKTGPVAEEITKAVVDTTEAGVADLTALLETPSGKKVEPKITPLEDGKYEVEYQPEEAGPHKLNVKYGDDHVKNSPFPVKVAPSGDASKVKVSGNGLDKPRVGQLVDIEFDASKAGKGHPKCTIKSPSGKDVPVEMIDNGDGTFTCKWTPTEEGVHDVDVTYGGEPVRGSPFKVKAVKPIDVDKIKSNVQEEVESGPCVDQPLEFGVDPRDAEKDGPKGTLSSSIVTPSGKTEYPDVRANSDGTYAVTYTPKEPGIYSLTIKYDDEPIPGSPFQFEVVEGGPERVIAFGKGLERGIVEETCEFTVVTKDAGPGGLSLAVEGPSKTEIQCVDNGDGSCSVSYVPKEPGQYNVVVKFADKHIPGSPFAAEIFPKGTDLTDAGRRERPVVGKPCDVKLDIPDVDVERDFKQLTGTLRRPGSDKEEPIEVKKNPDGTLGVTFIPYEPGEHLISIKKRGKHVPNSPFSVMVEAPRLGDMFPSGRPADIDLSNIKGINPEDLPKLSASLRRPKSKVDESVKLLTYPNGDIGMSFVPREPGEHFLTVKKDGVPIPGSPFSILVESEEPVNAVGAPVEACLDLPGVNLPEDFTKLKGTLKRPSSTEEEPLKLVLNSDNSLSVSFTPRETGKHLIGVKKFNRHVNGSPIPVMVTAPEPVYRSGMPCGVDLKNVTPEDLLKLDAGLLRPGSQVEEPIRVKQNSDDSLSASFFPREEGLHKLNVRKDKKPVPESPYLIDVLSKDKVEEIYPVGRTCDVGLDIPGVNLPEDFKKLTATLKRPNSDKEEPLTLELYPDNTLGISFVPLEPGDHIIRVKKSGVDVPGSPFVITVDAPEAVNAVGRPCDCQMDIPELKLPEDLPKLKATLRRPGSDKEEPIQLKVLSDNTLSASFVPKSPGPHVISVTKDRRPVTGSPFTVMVTDTEPAHRVGRPAGIGLEDIPVEDLPRLEAGLQRPGSDVEEPIRIKQNSDNVLSATFVPHEEGVHKIHVRKDKKPLPQSPYLVNVLGKDAVEEVHPVGRTCDVGLDIPGVNLPDDFKKLTATLQRPSSNKEEPVNLELNPDNTLGVTFAPTEPGQHWIRVKKSGQEIPESPFPVMVERDQPEEAVGSLCDVPLSSPDITNPKEDLPNLKATLKRPDSTKEEPVQLKVLSDNTLSVSFVPKTPGEHLITVKKRNRPVKGSPFSIMVTADEPHNTVGHPASVPFENVPAGDMPKLEATRQRPGSEVEEPVTVKKASDDTLYAQFMPHEEGPHKVNVRKDKKPVPDSPYVVDVFPAKKPVEEMYPVKRPCDIAMDIPGVNLPEDITKITATLQRPNSTKEEPLTPEINPDNTLGLNFVPHEPGKHIIRVKKSGKEVPGSPFIVLVEPDEPEEAVGGLCDVPLSSPDITNPREDLPKLTATLKRPDSTKEEPIKLKVLSDNTLSASFVPKTPGEHLITVKKRNRPVKGSPFSVMVTAEEPNHRIGKPSQIPFENVPGEDLPKVDAGLKRPGSKVEEPITVKKASDDTLYAQFIPHEKGPHEIDVRKDKKPVPDSPYVVDVPEEGAKPKKPVYEEVHPVGRPCDVGMDIPGINLPEDFNKLTATLQRPKSKKEEPVKLELNPDNTLGISFLPLETGNYTIRIKFSGKEIPGNVYKITVDESQPEFTVGSPCLTPINIPGMKFPDDFTKLTATLRRPGSTRDETITLKMLSDYTLAVSFLPKITGEYSITVKKNNRPVTGSPFSVSVTGTEPKPTIRRSAGIPLEELPSKDRPKFDATLQRPGSKVDEPVPIRQTSDNTLYAVFVPREKGPHTINVRKDKKPLPEATKIIDVPDDKEKPRRPGEEKPEPKRPTLKEIYPLGSPCDIIMDLPGVNLPEDFKKLTTTLERPNKKEEPVKGELHPNNTFGVSFVPTEPGKYTIKVTGKDVPETTREITVEDKKPEFTVGSPCNTPLDTKGLTFPDDLPRLTAFIKRPGSTKEEPITPKLLSDNTLSASFLPKTPGDYEITLKKRNRPVGSPKTVPVSDKKPKPTVGKPSDVPFEKAPVKDLPKLDAVLKRPGSDVEEPVTVKKTSDDTVYASFVPQEEGPHEITVRKDKKPLPDCKKVIDVPKEGEEPERPEEEKPKRPEEEKKPKRPAVEEVYPMDSPCDIIMDLPDVKLPEDFKKLTTTVKRPNKKEEPVKPELHPNDTFGVSFVPTEPGKYTVKVTGKDVPETTREVTVEDKKPEFTVGSPCNTPLDTKGLTFPDDLPRLTAFIKRPGSTKEEPITPKLLSDNTLSASFLPKTPGDYEITLKKRNRPVGSPKTVPVSDKKPKPTVGKPSDVPFEKAPVKDLPKLDAVIKRPGSDVEEPVTVKKTSDDTVYTSFVPQEEGPHEITVRKDKKPLPDCKKVVDVPKEGEKPERPEEEKPKRPEEEKPKRPAVEEIYPMDRPCDIIMDLPGVKLPEDFKKLTTTMKRPNKKEEPVKPELHPNDTFGVSFVPTEPGTYTIKVTGKDVPETTREITVEKTTTEYTIGSPCNTPLDTKGLTFPDDLPRLTAFIKRPGSTKEEPITPKLLSDNTLSASFLPKTPGDYVITLKKRNRPVGSPKTVPVSDKKPKPTVGKPSDVPFEKAPVKDLPKLDAVIKRPGSDVEEPVTVKKTSDDTVYASFVPQEEGPHEITVRKDKKPLPDCKQVVDVPKEGEKPGRPGEEKPKRPEEEKPKRPGEEKPKRPAVEEVYPMDSPCDIIMDLPDVKLPEDFKKLTTTVKRPNKKEEPVKPELHPNDTFGVSFVPTEPGTYTIKVTGKDVPETTREITVEKTTTEYTIGSPCNTPLDTKGLTFPDDLPRLTAFIKRPGSTKEEPITPKLLSDNTLSASFLPKTPGDYVITLKKRNRPVGSPKTVPVSDKKPKPTVGKPSDVPFEKAPVKDLPKLDAVIKRPGSDVEEPVTVKKTSDDTVYASFVPQEEGPHEITVRKDKKPLPDCKQVVDVPKEEEKPERPEEEKPKRPEEEKPKRPEEEKPKRPAVEEVYPMDSPCDIIMDLPGVKLPEDFKKLTTTVKRPNKKEEPVKPELHPNDTFGVSFVPTEPGTYTVKVTGKDVPETTREITVEKTTTEYTIGSPCNTPLDTKGLTFPDDLPRLTAFIKRPGSTKEEPITPKLLSDNTLTASFLPKTPGDYEITLKKRNRPVGSPKTVQVSDKKPKPTVGKPSDVPFEKAPVKDLPKLDAVIKRPGSDVEEPVPIKKTSDDTVYASFVPQEEGPHEITVRKDKKPLPDCKKVMDVPKEEEKPKRPEEEKPKRPGEEKPKRPEEEKPKRPEEEKKPERPVVEEVHPMGRPCDVVMDLPGVKLPEDFKKLTTTVKRPNDEENPVKPELRPDDTLGVSFVPTQPGKYTIKVTGKDIPETTREITIEETTTEYTIGSPCDTPLDIKGLNLPDDLQRLSAVLKRPGSTKEEPITPKLTSDNKLSASFVPKTPGDYEITVKKRNRPVGSPVTVPVSDKKPKPDIGKPSDVLFEKAPVKDLPKLDAVVKRPGSDVEEPVPIKKTSDDTVFASFVPEEVGPHEITVRKDKKPLPDCKKVVDVPKEEEKPKRPGEEKPKRPEEEKPKAPGVKEKPKRPEEEKPKRPEEEKPKRPEEEKPKRPEEEKPKRPEEEKPKAPGVKEKPKRPEEVGKPKRPEEEEKPERPVVEEVHPMDRPVSVQMDLPGVKLPEDFKKLNATVQRPKTKKDEPITPELNPDNTMGVSFVPTEPGKYTIKVTGKDVPETTREITVEDKKPENPVGSPCETPLIIEGLNLPDDITRLSATIKRPGSRREEPITPKLLSDNTLSASFLPKTPGDYEITVKKRHRPVGNPVSVKVTETEPEEAIGRPSTVTFEDLPVRDLPKLDAVIRRPTSDVEEPVTIRKTSDDTLYSTFIPEEEGPHQIIVRKDKRPLPEFSRVVEVPAEEAQPERPEEGKPKRPGEEKPKRPDEKEPVVEELHPVGRTCDVSMDLPGINLKREFKNLKATIERPSSKKEEPLTLELKPDNTLGIKFLPTEAGTYTIHIRIHDRDMVFTITVGEKKPEEVVIQPIEVPLHIPDLKLPDDLASLTSTIKRPGSDKEEPIILKVLPDNTLCASFVPTISGEYLITVKKRYRNVPGSPFSIKVTVDRPEEVPPQREVIETITVEEREPGLEAGAPESPTVEEVYPVGRPCDVDMTVPGVNLPKDFNKLTATLKRPSSDKEEPVKLYLNPDNTLGISFVPVEPGRYLIRIMLDGKKLPGVFEIIVEETETEHIVGGPCDTPLNIPGLNLPEDLPKLKATLRRPDSTDEEPLKLKLLSDNTLSVSFVAKAPGEHFISIKKNRRDVPGSPLSVMVTGTPRKRGVGRPLSVHLENVPVRDLPKLTAGLQRPGSDEEEPLVIKQASDDTLYVSFFPRDQGPHKIIVRKDKKPIPGSPFIVDITDKGVPSERPSDVPTHTVGQPYDITLTFEGISLPRDFKYLTATIQRPGSDKEEPIELTLKPDNTLGISFVPMEPGEHLVRVKKDGEDVPGSPFSVMVEAAEAVNAVGRPCDCHLDIPGLNLPADLKSIKSTLKRPDSDTEEPVKLKVLSDNTLSVSFVPRSPGEHLISVKKFNRHLAGSPFSVMVTAPETASQSVGRPCGLGLEIPGLKLPEDFELLTAVLKRPGSPSEEPLKLVLNSDNTLSVSFIPKETGEHLISVFKNKRHVTGSPFSVMVSGPGPADASKVKAYGDGLEWGVVNEKAEFTVNTRDAGYGGLGLSIEGPSKADITCVDNEDGTCTVDYVPTEPGDYTIHVRFADEEIPGSPFKSTVVPPGGKRPPRRRPIVDEGITRATERQVESEAPAQRTSQLLDDLVSFSPQQPHDFALDLKGYDVKDLKATVETPSGRTEPADIVETSPGTYTIRFVTKEGGVYKISVKSRGRHIPGSPFKVQVDAPKWGGAQKCIAAGPGLERGVVNKPADFTVWTRDAGPGGLAVAIEGPAKTEIDCKDNGDGSCSISYVPTEPGEYTVHVRFADENIPSAPFKVFVTAEEDERFRDLSVSDMAESGISVGQPASFSVETNGPVGEVTASVLAPSGTESPATISDRGNGSYAIRFVPKEVGDHLISVRFDGIHIPGSPFKVKVGGGESYPGKVKAFGPGLEGGVAGQETYFTVDALRAGTGALALSVDGPAKVRMNCTENPDGTYRVTYLPMVAGDYKITIKFADAHIPHSPYNVTITGDGLGNAEKCKPDGSGLHRAVIGEPNAFTVNCSDAGRGSLMVGVEGPAIPAKEIRIKHTGGKVYAVNYTLEEPGEYILKVLWGEKHIPGSPFHVTV